MLRFNPNWFHRIMRNAEPEVHVTVIESPPVTEVPVSEVATAVDDAARIAALAASLSKTDPEMLATIQALASQVSGMNGDLAAMREQLSRIETNTAVTVVAEVAQEVEEEIIEEVATELPREEIPPAAIPPTEEPKKRNRRWI